MVDVTKTTMVVLNNKELTQAVIDFVSSQYSGELDEMKPETMMLHIPDHGRFYVSQSGGLTVEISSK